MPAGSFALLEPYLVQKLSNAINFDFIRHRNIYPLKRRTYNSVLIFENENMMT